MQLPHLVADLLPVPAACFEPPCQALTNSSFTDAPAALDQVIVVRVNCLLSRLVLPGYRWWHYAVWVFNSACLNLGPESDSRRWDTTTFAGFLHRHVSDVQVSSDLGNCLGPNRLDQLFVSDVNLPLVPGWAADVAQVDQLLED